MKKNAENKKNNVPFKQMSLGDHLEELRMRIILALLGLIVALVCCLFFSKFFLAVLARPYLSAVESSPNATLQAIALPEKFAIYIKTALLFSVIFSSPWIIYQLWQFISAGLYANEKKYIYIITPLCTTLFVAGAAFYIFVVAPMIIQFFVGFDTGIKFLTTQVTISSYMGFMFTMTLVFGLCFQMPVAIVAINKLGIVSKAQLKAARKYVLLLLFVIAAVMTPPDIISQISLGLPMYLLFEAGLLFCKN